MRTRKNTRIVTLALAAVCAALVSAPTVRAEPPTPAAAPATAAVGIAVYALVAGVPVDVTALASYGDGQVYLSGTWFGTVQPNGDIVNSGIVVGLLSLS